MMKSLVTIIAIVALGACALGQSGTSAPAQMIPYGGLTVSILLPDGKPVAETTADSEGKFAFNNLKPGNYVLRVSNAAGSKGQASPRDVATGAATGKRQMATSTSSGSSGASQTVGYSSPVQTPRDAASGQASGRSATSSSGQATPAKGVVTARETGSGMATGRRSATADAPGDSMGGGSSDQVEVVILESSANSRVNTSRSNIKHQKAMSIGDGTPVSVDASGQLVGNLLKTKHDTVKNSISNIR